ncbi:MAG: heme A synthase [Sphingomonas sanxanigenens]|uniref:Heme A synthase n=1 Tax=Sphingomonas sanxanigenens TaxID=397260 RepID=A0A2W5C385_9SPHN|nr:MAG: heme A synthase [Sphingomonas sanxanigenens]
MTDTRRFSQSASRARPRPRAISNWLLWVAALVFLMVVVGGITRLTESGLSIAEWKPLTGAIPPLNDAQWQAEFAHYKGTTEYQTVNRGMDLAAFKAIFFWEYLHRLIGRLIGVAFALPLIWFAAKRAIPKGYGWRLVGILALGGLQGAIGWWMVVSGLVGRVDVSHIRLAVHLMTALLIYSALIWTALDLKALARNARAKPARLTGVAIIALGLLACQIMFGAFTAGLRAGYAFSSWPMMGDAWFPADTPMLSPMLRNLVDNPIVVQFVHRWLAFVAAAGLAVLTMRAAKRGARTQARAVAGLLALQILLGIATLLSGVMIEIAVAHQAVAALLLGASVATAHALGRRNAR